MEELNNFTNKQTIENKVTSAYGIDLGTTNSCISVVDNAGVPKVITLDNGKTTMPSCVLWDVNKQEGERFIVGDEAYHNRYKSNACYSVKRLMGTDSLIKLTHGNKSITKTPVEISALILEGLVKKASRIYKDIKDVVITVPAEFNTKQVEDTKKAAELAGLNVLNIMREPTAASLVYRLDEKPGSVLVYDLGGGTFDVSIVEIQKASSGDSDLFNLLGVESVESKDTITVKATRGNTKLGGDDLDKFIYEILEKKMKEQGCKVNLIKDEDKEKLLLQIEGYKKMTDFIGVNIEVNFTLKDGSKFKSIVQLDRDDVIRATIKIFNLTKPYINDVLKSANANIHSIVLVGGSTKNVYLQQLLQEAYPDVEVYKYLNPDESVSLGASINAKREKFGSDTLEVFDVTSNAIGVLADGRVSPVIEKNQSIPCTRIVEVSTIVDNQQQVRIQVYEGSSPYPQNDTYLGDVIVNDVPKGKAGTVRVQVALTVDNNGLLTCEVITKNGRKKVELLNILGKRVEKDDNKESSVMFDRWYAFANRLGEPEKSELIELIDAARVEPNKKEVVAKYISRAAKQLKK